MFATLFQSPKSTPLGCSLHDNGLRLMQCRPTRKGTREAITHFSSHPLVDPRDLGTWKPMLVAALQEALQTGRFTSREVVISLPTSLMVYRRMRMASMPTTEMTSAVRWRAARDLGAGVGELRTGFYMVNSSSQCAESCHEVIVVTSRNHHINQCVEAFTAAGLHVLAVDAPAGALMRALSLDSRETSPSLVIDIGISSSTVMVMQQGQPCYIRTIPNGKCQIVQQAATRLGLDATGHADLWDILNRGQEGHPCEATPHQTLAQLASQHASELSHEARLCTQYLRNLDNGEHQPIRGCVLGAGQHENLYMDTLRKASGVPFVCLKEMLDPGVYDLLASEAGDVHPEAWLTAFGLVQHPGQLRTGEVA